MAEVVRVVLADDNYLVREGTRRLLEDSGEVQVLAGVSNAEELLDAVARLAPDAVLTDIRMPPGHQMEGIDAAHTIRARHPAVGVVVLSQYSEAAYAIQLFRDGTGGLAYLLKSGIDDVADLLHALREVTAGRSVVDARVVERLVDRRTRQMASPLGSFSPRELDVLREMASGKTNAAIGEALHLSESSIEKHVNSIFGKLGLSEDRGVSRRVAAVLAFLRDPDASAD